MALKANKVFSNIKQGLNDALAFSQGKPIKAVVHHVAPLDVKNIRAGIGMSQSEFASAFGISVSTLRHWERGDRVPQGPARVLLNIVAKDPGAVLKALNK